jgi:hypothetical protein
MMLPPPWLLLLRRSDWFAFPLFFEKSMRSEKESRAAGDCVKGERCCCSDGVRLFVWLLLRRGCGGSK